LRLKDGISPSQIPDSTIIRLRNLIAIDAEGNDHHIGAEPLVIYNPLTASHDIAEYEISIYPNPTDGLVYVDVPYEVQGQIINVQGQVLKNLTILPNESIDISELSPGIYFLRLKGFFTTYKVVVH
ncbi:MAG TPA: T9SS type A sorting domain-containing protein, partial [Saprospiraceae bacterium]|nr:T9SS type A sorting domain-containing protein [Saprospiraceae bacterium]